MLTGESRQRGERWLPPAHGGEVLTRRRGAEREKVGPAHGRVLTREKGQREKWALPAGAEC